MSPRQPKGKPETATRSPRRRAAPAAAIARVRRAPAAPDLSATPLDAIHLAGLDPRTLIAPNFHVYELTRSDFASRRGIANTFQNDSELRAAVHLARQVLQPVRDAFGSFTPNSVYRSQPLERALKDKPSTWLLSLIHI